MSFLSGKQLASLPGWGAGGSRGGVEWDEGGGGGWAWGGACGASNVGGCVSASGWTGGSLLSLLVGLTVAPSLMFSSSVVVVVVVVAAAATTTATAGTAWFSSVSRPLIVLRVSFTVTVSDILMREGYLECLPRAGDLGRGDDMKTISL